MRRVLKFGVMEIITLAGGKKEESRDMGSTHGMMHRDTRANG